MNPGATFEIGKLELHHGDLLVVNFAFTFPEREEEKILLQLKDMLPDTRLIVLYEGAQISVIRPPHE